MSSGYGKTPNPKLLAEGLNLTMALTLTVAMPRTLTPMRSMLMEHPHLNLATLSRSINCDFLASTLTLTPMGSLMDHDRLAEDDP